MIVGIIILKFYFLFYFCLCWALLLWGFFSACTGQGSSAGAGRGSSWRWSPRGTQGLQASGLRALRPLGSWALGQRLSSCGTWAQLLRSTRDPPGSGVEPVSPELAGGFLTLEPLGKPCYFIIICWSKWVYRCTLCKHTSVCVCTHAHISTVHRLLV